MIFRYLIPAARFVIHSPLSREKALEALRGVVETPKWLHLSARNACPYEGEVEDSGFRMTPVVIATGRRSSYPPLIVGSIDTAGSGSAIHVRMRHLIVVIGTMAIINFIALLITPVVIFLLWQEQQFFGIPGVIGLAGFVFFLVNTDFWRQLAEHKKRLAAVFQATGVEDEPRAPVATVRK